MIFLPPEVLCLILVHYLGHVDIRSALNCMITCKRLWKCRYFIETATLKNRLDPALVCAMPNLKKLHINYTSNTYHVEHKHIIHLTQLETLIINSYYVKDIGYSISKMSRLSKLEIRTNSLVMDIWWFKDLPLTSLKLLYIHLNIRERIRDKNFNFSAKLCANFISLQKLSLGGVWITDKHLEYIHLITSLKKLELIGMIIQGSCLLRITSLEHLKLSKTDILWKELVNKLTYLSRLSLSDEDFTYGISFNSRPYLINNLTQFVNLTRLDALDHKLTYSHISNMTNLKILQVCELQMTPEEHQILIDRNVDIYLK